MNPHFIKNVKSTVNKLDAVTKAYVDRIKYKTATGNILTHIIIFPLAKAFAAENVNSV